MFLLDEDVVVTPLSGGQAVARMNDPSSHGGTIIEGSDTVLTNGRRTARKDDRHSCPVRGHGVTALIPTTKTVFVDGREIIRVGDRAGCGAVITQGSPNVFAGG